MYRDTVFTIIVNPDVSRYCLHDCCLPLFCGCTRGSLCLLSVLVIWTTQSDPSIRDVFPLEIHCRKVSNAQRVTWKERVNWKASRATCGAACLCEVGISGGVHQVVVDQVVICSQMNRSLWSFSRREVQLSVIFLCFFLPCLMGLSQGCSHISFGSRLRALDCEQNQSF